MNGPAADIQRVVDRYLRDEASVSMVVMELVQLTEDPAALARALPTLSGDPARLGELERHLAANEAGCRTIVRMLRQRLQSGRPRDERGTSRFAERDDAFEAIRQAEIDTHVESRHCIKNIDCKHGHAAGFRQGAPLPRNRRHDLESRVLRRETQHGSPHAPAGTVNK